MTSDASILREDISSGPPRASFDGIVLGYGYDSAVIVPDGSPAPAVDNPVHDYVPTARPGHRAPHVWVDVDGRHCSTLDLFGEAFTLLVAGGPKPQPEVGNVPLRTHALNSPDWRHCYGVDPGGMVLVRPDGHVAARWRVQPSNPDEALRVALRTSTAARG